MSVLSFSIHVSLFPQTISIRSTPLQILKPPSSATANAAAAAAAAAGDIFSAATPAAAKEISRHRHERLMDLSPNPESPTPPGSGGGGGSSGAGGSSGGGASSSAGGSTPQTPSRYEAQKRRDWNTFGQYLRNHRPPLSLAQCSGAHVLEFLRYLDQFGKTKVHTAGCPFFGHPNPPAPCPCPLRQAWGSLDALVGRLRAAFEEHGGRPESNPFAARAVRLFLREVREHQARARGVSYEKKKRKKPPSGETSGSHHHPPQPPHPPPPDGAAC